MGGQDKVWTLMDNIIPVINQENKLWFYTNKEVHHVACILHLNAEYRSTFDIVQFMWIGNKTPQGTTDSLKTPLTEANASSNFCYHVI